MKPEWRIQPETDALIVEGVQIDFCPGGALAVPDGDAVVPILNRWLAIPGLLKIASRDWRPLEHCSFARNGGAWPDHCVQNTRGALLHPDLDQKALHRVIEKATDPNREACSSFDAPEMFDALRGGGVDRLWVGGLATEYSVRATVLDGLRMKYKVFVITDGVRGVEVHPGDVAAALKEMTDAGAVLVTTDDVLGPAVQP